MRVCDVARLALGAGMAGLLSTTALAAADNTSPVMVFKEVKHDLSPPLREMQPPVHQKGLHITIPVRPIPLPEGTLLNQPDGALQSETAGTKVQTTDLLNFAGVGQGDYGFSDQYAPPDTNGAVGATQYVQWVNVNFAIFDKTNGNLVYGPVAGNTLWQGFGGTCQSQNNGDIIAQYDKLAGRWVMAQPVFFTTPYSYCVAVSQTSDATGAWYRYQFTIENNQTDFPDYPKLGVWPDGYYVTFNIFQGGFKGAALCALDRNSMLVGNAATDQCFQLSGQYGGVLPSDFDGTIAPPAGSPNYLINFGSSSLNEWQFHVDWTNPANSTLSAPIKITVPSFSPTCGGGSCIPQPNTTQKLDTLADRMMYRLAYRNFGDHESLVVDHSVSAKSRSGIRWYELRTPSSPTLYQSGTFAAGKVLWRWMGSIAMDKMGDIAVGYSTSAASKKYPSIAYTGRVPSDPAGKLEGQKTTTVGKGSQTGGLSRWGDYSAMSVDPTDDCTFYYTTEYLKTSGSFNWSTRINSFKFNNCQ